MTHDWTIDYKAGLEKGYRAGIEDAAQRVENLYTSNGPQCAAAIRALADEKVKP